VIYSLGVSLVLSRLQRRHLMVIGGAIATAAMLIIALDLSWPLQVAAFGFLGLGFYTLHASIQVEVTELSATARGAATAMHSLFFFVGQALGPVLYGFGFAHLGGTRSVLIGAAVVMAVGLMCAHYLRRRDLVA
jgi:predicted MFS family arabinose efflux permease